MTQDPPPKPTSGHQDTPQAAENPLAAAVAAYRQVRYEGPAPVWQADQLTNGALVHRTLLSAWGRAVLGALVLLVTGLTVLWWRIPAPNAPDLELAAPQVVATVPDAGRSAESPVESVSPPTQLLQIVSAPAAERPDVVPGSSPEAAARAAVLPASAGNTATDGREGAKVGAAGGSQPTLRTLRQRADELRPNRLPRAPTFRFRAPAPPARWTPRSMPRASAGQDVRSGR